MMGDFRIDRARQLDLAEAIDSGYVSYPEGAAKMVGRIFDGGSMPTSGDHYFLVHRVEFDADPVEGGTATATPDTSAAIPVIVLGTKLPVAGDDLHCYHVGGRWVARKGGGHAVYLCPNCDACDVIRLAQVGTVTDGNGTTALVYDQAFDNWHTSSGLTGFGLIFPSGPTAGLACASGTGDIPYGYTLQCNGDNTLTAGVSFNAAIGTTGTPPAFIGYSVVGSTTAAGCTGYPVTGVLTQTSLDCDAMTATFDVHLYLGTTVPPDPDAVEIPAPASSVTFSLAPEPVPPSVCCDPCPIPTADLTLSYTLSDLSEGSTTMHFGSDTDPYPWVSDCLTITVGGTRYVRFSLKCDGGIKLLVETSFDGVLTCGNVSSTILLDSTTLEDFTCLPAHWHWSSSAGAAISPFTDLIFDPS